MVDPNTRQGKRTPVTLKIKFKSETIEQFIERYAVDVSQGGIFVRTKEPLGVGTQMRFEFQLRDASPLIAGEGTVVWTRENDPSRPAIAPGMGVRFDRLAEGSQGVLERILAEKAKQAPQRGNTNTSRPPMFSDTPTRVAPAPVQEALLGEDNGQARGKRADSFGDSGTPLPKPTPWHTDADDFPEEAFEEATKVRALDDLIAATATDSEAATRQDTNLGAADRADSTISDATVVGPPSSGRSPTTPPAASPASSPDYSGTPRLPSLPDPGSPGDRPQPRLLDASPSPRTEPAAAEPSSPGQERPRPAIKDVDTVTSGIRAALPSELAASREPIAPDAPPPRKSMVGTILFLLVVLGAAGGAVWWFVLRDQGTPSDAKSPPPPTPSATRPSTPPTPTPPSTPPSTGAGSGSATHAGSAGSAGSAASAASAGSATPPPPPPVNGVDTVIASSVETSTVEIVGAGQSGPAPFTAKLEKGKPYKARVQAPGFIAQEIDVTGGQDKLTAKLVAKPYIVTANSTPPGAAIWFDSGPTGHVTPFDVPVPKALVAKKSLRVTLRKPGFKPVDRTIELTAFAEEDARMVITIDEQLTQQAAPPRPRPPANGGTSSGGSSGTGSGAGSAATPPTGGGTAAPPADPPSTPPAGGGGGSAAPAALKPAAAPTPSATPPAAAAPPKPADPATAPK